MNDTGTHEPQTHEQGFSSKSAAQIAGITYRQLDYWARRDIVRPSLTRASGSGSRRLYSYRDLLELRVIKTLIDSGIKLQQVRKGLNYLRDQLGEGVASASLVISGSNSIVVNTEGELVELLQNGQGVLNVLPLGSVKDTVDATIIDLFEEGHDFADAGDAVADAAAAAI